MPPKKLILNPPKNPAQQPTPRIKFTNSNKDNATPGITVDEEARKRQHEHVKAASRGQVFRSTNTPIRMTQRGNSGRGSPHINPAPVGKVEAGLKRSASVASIGAVDTSGDVQHDSTMTDASPDVDQPKVPPDNPDLMEEAASAPTMQPPAVIPQQPQSNQVTHPPPTRPPYQVTTAFDRYMREAGKGKKFLISDSAFAC